MPSKDKPASGDKPSADPPGKAAALWMPGSGVLEVWPWPPDREHAASVDVQLLHLAHRAAGLQTATLTYAVTRSFASPDPERAWRGHARVRWPEGDGARYEACSWRTVKRYADPSEAMAAAVAESEARLLPAMAEFAQ